ncbi:hypothetical protein [Caproiciproducens sp. MSJ-32]|uniref:hypothetical protein n=1 Tax=Caproiciproducens sp. MSJ-32 TaxID=2841527 RepID=UPI001C112307|nr:hypothetical protein [Caproiciproducens sp. MSJ-32]MBU5455684.1 hypothetical protein [Caproiciproducens sp. MSJ-32]
MINKNYLKNIPAKNTIREENKRVLSEDLSNTYSSDLLSNMILNSNLNNDNIIR